LYFALQRGVPALKTCFALHFTAETWRGLKGKGILIYHVLSGILNQRCLKKNAALFDIKKSVKAI